MTTNKGTITTKRYSNYYKKVQLLNKVLQLQKDTITTKMVQLLTRYSYYKKVLLTLLELDFIFILKFVCENKIEFLRGNTIKKVVPQDPDPPRE